MGRKQKLSYGPYTNYKGAWRTNVQIFGRIFILCHTEPSCTYFQCKQNSTWPSSNCVNFFSKRIFIILKTYQLRNVDPIAEQVGDDLLGVVHGPVRVPIDQDLLQTLVHQARNLVIKKWNEINYTISHRTIAKQKTFLDVNLILQWALLNGIPDNGFNW